MIRESPHHELRLVEVGFLRQVHRVGSAIAGIVVGAVEDRFLRDDEIAAGGGGTAQVLQAKLVVWRISDHWSSRQPDPRVAAIAEALSWKDGPGSDNIYRIPETSLSSPKVAIPVVAIPAIGVSGRRP